MPQHVRTKLIRVITVLVIFRANYGEINLLDTTITA